MIFDLRFFSSCFSVSFVVNTGWCRSLDFARDGFAGLQRFPFGEAQGWRLIRNDGVNRC